MVTMTQWRQRKKANNLVLSRKPNETLLIGDDVRVTVSRVVGDRVTLLIQAPSSVRIMRSEIVDVEAAPESLTDIPS